MKCPKCNYENTGENSLYCGLCYEPLNKPAKPEPAEPAAEPLEPQRNTTERWIQIALIAGMLSGAGIYFYGRSAPGSWQASGGSEAVRLQEKMAAAETLLAAYNLNRADLLGEIAKGEIDPTGFGLEGQYTKKLFQLEEDYRNGLNALELGCPKCAKETDAAYSQWAKEQQAKETAAMEDFNRKYLQLLKQAAPK